MQWWIQPMTNEVASGGGVGIHNFVGTTFFILLSRLLAVSDFKDR